MFESDRSLDHDTPPQASSVDESDAGLGGHQQYEGHKPVSGSDEEPVTDDTLTDEQVDELVEAAVQVSCVESAARLQLVKLIARLDGAGVWQAEGQTCLANWIALRFGVSRRTARQIGLVAKRIDELPALAEAFGDGRLSWDQLVALCQLATPKSDAGWAADGAGYSAEDLAKMVRSRRLTAERARDIHDHRGVIGRSHRSGGTELRVVLENSDAAVVLAELDRTREHEAVADPETGKYPTVAQQRADALVSLAHRGLGADGDVDRATVVLHADAPVVCDGDDDGHCSLPDGTPVAAETVRRLACDGRIEWAIDGPDGVTLGVGRASRTWPAWLARQIAMRDGGRCRFPGCPNRIHHIHHTAEWVAHKGRTDSRNGIGFCWTHHHLVHEGHWTVTGNADHTLTFTSPDGRVVLESPVRKLSPQVKTWMKGALPSLFEDA